jgi:hypothetical protein
VREFLRPADIANEISMKRSLFGGSFLIVEGVTDGRLYGKFADRQECEVIPAHSKDNVKISVRELFGRRNDKKVIGIIDSDTDLLKGIRHERPLFMTDCRDIETLMIRGPALDDILTEYGDNDRMESFVNRYGTIRDAVAASCYPLGLLMYVSDMNEYGLSFRDPDHQMFVDRKSLRTDIKAMIAAVVDNSPHSTADVRTITAQLSRELRNERDPWDVCRGRDMISVLAIGLRDIFGGYNSKYIRTGELAGALRLAYTKESFRTTDLYRDTSEWCSARNMRVWS